MSHVDCLFVSASIALSSTFLYALLPSARQSAGHALPLALRCSLGSLQSPTEPHRARRQAGRQARSPFTLALTFALAPLPLPLTPLPLYSLPFALTPCPLPSLTHHPLYPLPLYSIHYHTYSPLPHATLWAPGGHTECGSQHALLIPIICIRLSPPPLS
jgi:hypothetical protein